MPKTFEKVAQKQSVEKINYFLEEASILIKRSERGGCDIGSYYMLRAIYHQNEAIIELLKQIQSIKD